MNYRYGFVKGWAAQAQAQPWKYPRFRCQLKKSSIPTCVPGFQEALVQLLAFFESWGSFGGGAREGRSFFCLLVVVF